jgi:hypothetical protein
MAMVSPAKCFSLVSNHPYWISSVNLYTVDVLKCIVEVGFEKSPYPVILCLHNHCSAKVQLRVVQLLKSTLKKMLALPSEVSTLASPNSLKGQVLIRCAKGAIVDDEEEDKKKSATAAATKSSATELIPELAALSYFGVERGEYMSVNPDRPTSSIDTVWRITDSEAASLSTNSDRLDKLHRYHLSRLGCVSLVRGSVFVSDDV